ncbi:sensor histidine kinase [Rhizomonospora bruguierae]|uniref:sensor histidine kinase n=1 Tax=Rhizomonospora bruguierae TaxID=1581705 RepID=UPI001BD09457|nr:sensor histidine kinase [Micromonospora sp. NBRC 107566]
MTRGRVWAADAALAAALLVIGQFGSEPAGRRQPGTIPPDPVGYALVAAAALSVALRRRWPLGTLAVTTVATSAYLALGHPYGPVLLSFMVAVYSVARHEPPLRATIGCLAALPLLLVHVFVNAAQPLGLVAVVPASAWIVVPFAVGLSLRLYQEGQARGRAEAQRRYADEERLRIAQEVHDVVGHGLAAITMQAEVALHLLAKRPVPGAEPAREALAAIGRSSREALDELRATLTVVRAPRQPGPGLGRLADLLERVRAAGVPVTLTTTGEPHDLPAALDLAAYRVVQESLTNVLRHAGATTAQVRVGYREGAVDIEVLDTGAGAAGFAAGHGISGMRERVTAVGGEFTAGPRDGRGFRVRATLPVAAR